MHAKDFGKKAGLSGSHAAISVYRWERGKLKLSNKTLAGIKKLFFSKRLISVMEILGNAIAEIEDVPEKLDLTFYPNEDTYKYFHGDEAPPFLLYQETNQKIINILQKLGVSVSLLEVNKLIYTRWLENRELKDNQETRTMFISNYA